MPKINVSGNFEAKNGLFHIVGTLYILCTVSARKIDTLIKPILILKD